MAGGDRTARGLSMVTTRIRETIVAPVDDTRAGEPGSETWPNKELPDAWKYGGGATWQPGSYDPQLDLFFIARQRGAVQPEISRRHGQPLCGICARDPSKTGELVWHYQFLPNDSFRL